MPLDKETKTKPKACVHLSIPTCLLMSIPVNFNLIWTNTFTHNVNYSLKMRILNLVIVYSFVYIFLFPCRDIKNQIRVIKKRKIKTWGFPINSN